jgi:ATP-dependent DNA ligase
MASSVPMTLEPMEAEPVDRLPAGPGWQFEPKWDGFRCLAYRDGAAVHIQSRNRKPLARYFPELVDALRGLPVERFVLDGELVVRGHPFDALQMRLHPAASRIEKLARSHPATIVAFDMLADARGRALLDRPLGERRVALEAFFAEIGEGGRVELSPATSSRATALRWLARGAGALDGIVAKRRDDPYQPGRRAMLKYKIWKTVDCVVGGLYWQRQRRVVDSLLLGLYDGERRLHYVGRARAGFDPEQMTARLTPLIGRGGFNGRAPGGVSRWSRREREAVPVKPVLVAEVSADRIENRRFRHGARLLRLRDDKRPEACTLDQLAH